MTRISTSCARVRGREKLDHRIAGARNRGDRDQIAQGPIQFGFRLFHRDHEIESSGVPSHYTRKQTTVGGERFITPELKEMEAKILGADERARNLEYQLFQRFRDETLVEHGPIQRTAAAIAVVDAICSLAETARLFHYCRPALSESLRLWIKDGRHPVLDQNLVEEKFVPNDTSLDAEICGWLSLPGRTWRANRLTSGRSH